MALSCMFRSSIKQLKVSQAKSLFLQNQTKFSSCISSLSTVQNNKSTLCSTRDRQLQVALVKQLSTSGVLRSAHGDHSKIWTAERALAAVMAGLMPLGMMMPSPLMDTLMAVSIVMHMHWGIEAVVIDYVRPVIFGPVIPKIGVMLVYAMSIATLAGLLNFIFNDVGIANGIRLLWKL